MDERIRRLRAGAVISDWAAKRLQHVLSPHHQRAPMTHQRPQGEERGISIPEHRILHQKLLPIDENSVFSMKSPTSVVFAHAYAHFTR